MRRHIARVRRCATHARVVLAACWLCWRSPCCCPRAGRGPTDGENSVQVLRRAARRHRGHLRAVQLSRPRHRPTRPVTTSTSRKAVGDKLGVNVEFVETPWDSIFAALEANRFDVVANEVTINPERQGEIRPVRAVLGRRGRDRHPRRRQLDHVAGRPQGQDHRRRSPRATGLRSPATPARGSKPWRASPRPSRCSTRAGSTPWSTTASRSTPTWPRPTTPRSRSPAPPARRASRGSPRARTAVCCPSSTRRSTSCAADGTLAEISQKYLKANASGGPDAAQADSGHRSAWQLILDNLWPLAKAAITMTIPLTIISFVIGLVIALGGGAGPVVDERGALQHRPVLHLDHPRHAAAGAVVHRVLRAARSSASNRPVPRGGDRVQPQRRWLRGRDHPLGDPEHPEGPVGGGRDHRPATTSARCGASSCRRPPGWRCRRCRTR